MYVCRELWFRASIAWQQILGDQSGNRNTLLVAHNAVNQALVATAIGLPPTYFRRLLQNNAATTVLDFQPTQDGPPRVNLDRLNQVRLPTQLRNVERKEFKRTEKERKDYTSQRQFKEKPSIILGCLGQECVAIQSSAASVPDGLLGCSIPLLHLSGLRWESQLPDLVLG